MIAELTLDSFYDAVHALLRLAKNTCTNLFSDRTVFIKSYNRSNSIVQYEIDSIIANNTYTAEQIFEDIVSIQKHGSNVMCIHLDLCYSIQSRTYISVHLIYSNNKVPIQYHFSIRCAFCDLNKDKYNVNDFIDTLLEHRKMED